MSTVPVHANTTLANGAPVVDDEIDLQSLLGTIADGKWLILVCMLVVSSCALLYVIIATPGYQADALLQVEKKQSGTGRIDDITALLTGEAQADAEIEIIRSRSVIGATVKQLKLEISARPHYFPLVGRAIARHFTGAEDELAEPWFGLSRYAWGGEEIEVNHLTVPPKLRDQPLVLVAGEEDSFQLYTEDHTLLLQGQVGKMARLEEVPGYSDKDGDPKKKGLEILVSELWARPGTEFLVTKLTRAEVVENIQKALEVNERGKQTGVIGLSYSGTDPERVAAIVNDIAETYLKQNVDRKSEDSEKMLSFLNSQLPKIKADLDAAETALNQHMEDTGNVDRSADLSLAAQSMIDQSKEVETRIAELEMQRAELRQKFTENHPKIIAVREKIEHLRTERDAIEKRMKHLPSTEIETVRHMRDVEVNKDIYVQLVNKTQELGVAKAGAIGNVRVLDKALVPEKPVKPKKAIILGASVALGMFMGVLLAFARRALNKGLDDPDILEQRLGLSVYAVIPHSDSQRRLFRRGKLRASFDQKVLAVSEPKDLAVESLRSLRTGLQFTLMEADNQVVSISGPAPGIGKSFVSVNLAHVLADTGKRVLLVDGDIRKGYLNDYFGVFRAPGLAEIITGEQEFGDVIHKTTNPNLEFLATGTIPNNPSELLESDRFRLLFAKLATAYDVVLYDTPPIMAVTDAAVIGRLAGVNLLVLKAGRHPLREISASIRRFGQSGGKVHGLILNDMSRKQGAHGYGKYSYYQYEYK